MIAAELGEADAAMMYKALRNSVALIVPESDTELKDIVEKANYGLCYITESNIIRYLES